MNKLLKSAALLLAGFGLAACSSDVSEPDAPTFKDGKAYLAVNIQYANSNTRALGDFENATLAEREVKTVDFYFYDDAGTYLTHAKPSATSNGAAPDPAVSIQFNVPNVVILEHLTNPMPSQMLCVINQPKSFVGMSFTEANKALQAGVTAANDAANIATANNFVMTSTSYKGNEKLGNCAVELTAGNFLQEAPSKENYTDENVINVYVERVAAKVTVGLKQELINAAVTTNLYKINDFNVDGNIVALYAEVSNWALNAVNKTYLPLVSTKNFGHVQIG